MKNILLMIFFITISSFNSLSIAMPISEMNMESGKMSCHETMSKDKMSMSKDKMECEKDCSSTKEMMECSYSCSIDCSQSSSNLILILDINNSLHLLIPNKNLITYLNKYNLNESTSLFRPPIA